MSDTRPIALLTAVETLRDTIRTLKRMLAAVAGLFVLVLAGAVASCATLPAGASLTDAASNLSGIGALALVGGIMSWLVVRRVR